jgi:hypothetical protein
MVRVEGIERCSDILTESDQHLYIETIRIADSSSKNDMNNQQT